MKVMILCHGRRHSLCCVTPLDALCGTSAFTRKTLHNIRYKTLDEDRSSRPHICHDITKPLSLHDRFDIVTAMYAPWFVYFDWATCDIIANTFINIRNMLKDNGYLVLCIADEGIYRFMRKFKLLSSRMRRDFYRCMFHGVPMRSGECEFMRDHVSSFISRYICTLLPNFQCITRSKKEKLLRQWNQTPQYVEDDHHLIILKHSRLH